MQLLTIPDLVGGNAAVVLSSTSRSVRGLIAVATGGAARIGDASVGVAQGAECPKDIPVIIYADPQDISARFDLSELKAYVPSGTTLTLSAIA